LPIEWKRSNKKSAYSSQRSECLTASFSAICRHAGLARKRFGGNIPLIGICTWGVLQQRENLEVSIDGAKLGYLNTPAVKYERQQVQKGCTMLDPNHSHFIMVRPMYAKHSVAYPHVTMIIGCGVAAG
jgi:hypothetical protein